MTAIKTSLNDVEGYITKLYDNFSIKTRGDMRFGIEVEFTGVSRRKLASYLVKEGYFIECNEEVHIVSGNRRIRLRLTDRRGAYWYLVVDRSIKPVFNHELPTDEDIDFMCELVTPVLKGNDLLFFLMILREIYNIGGVVNETCGIHVHIDMVKDIEALKSLVVRFLRVQHSLSDLFSIPEYRLKKYTKVFPKEFEEELMSCIEDINSIEELQDFLYSKLGQGVSRDDEKNPARYYMLNLDTIHKRGTIEFRMFNSTLNAGIISRYLGWVYDFCNPTQEG